MSDPLIKAMTASSKERVQSGQTRLELIHSQTQVKYLTIEVDRLKDLIVKCYDGMDMRGLMHEAKVIKFDREVIRVAMENEKKLEDRQR